MSVIDPSERPSTDILMEFPALLPRIFVPNPDSNVIRFTSLRKPLPSITVVMLPNTVLWIVARETACSSVAKTLVARPNGSMNIVRNAPRKPSFIGTISSVVKVVALAPVVGCVLRSDGGTIVLFSCATSALYSSSSNMESPDPNDAIR